MGACKNCKVCATVRTKRRIETKPKREANRTPGEEYNFDTMTVSHASKEGYLYVTAGRCSSSGHVLHFFHEDRKQTGTKLIECVDDVRSDPVINRKDIIRRIRFDPVGGVGAAMFSSE